jgi:hypothetical protein
MAIAALDGPPNFAARTWAKNSGVFNLQGNANPILVVPSWQHVAKDAGLKALTVPAEPAASRIGRHKSNTAP